MSVSCLDFLNTITSMKPPACGFVLKIPHLLAWTSDLTSPVEEGRSGGAPVLPRPRGNTFLQKRLPFTPNLNTRLHSVWKGLEMYILSKLQCLYQQLQEYNMNYQNPI